VSSSQLILQRPPNQFPSGRLHSFCVIKLSRVCIPNSGQFEVKKAGL
jgi:hypothetical protein